MPLGKAASKKTFLPKTAPGPFEAIGAQGYGLPPNPFDERTRFLETTGA